MPAAMIPRKSYRSGYCRSLVEANRVGQAVDNPTQMVISSVAEYVYHGYVLPLSELIKRCIGQSLLQETAFCTVSGGSPAKLVFIPWIISAPTTQHWVKHSARSASAAAVATVTSSAITRRYRFCRYPPPCPQSPHTQPIAHIGKRSDDPRVYPQHFCARTDTNGFDKPRRCQPEQDKRQHATVGGEVTAKP